MRKFIIAVSMFVATSAHAEKPNYHVVTMKAASCMDANAKYIRQLNDRSEEAMVHWLIDKCHDEYSQFLETYVGFTVEMRYKRLHAMATAALKEYPRAK